MAEVKREPGEPYCGECGYTLTGATDSSKCPECGRPLVDVLMRPMLDSGTGKRFRSKARIFGMPVIDIALGPRGSESMGRAKGFIAIGNIATGVLAIGGQARGVVEVGGLAMGGVSMGGMSLGLRHDLPQADSPHQESQRPLRQSVAEGHSGQVMRVMGSEGGHARGTQSFNA